MTLGDEYSSEQVRGWRSAKRSGLIKARSELSPEVRRQMSRRILQCLIDNFQELCSGTVGLYWPFRGEMDILPFADRIRAWGGTVSLPVVIAKGQPLEFRTWNACDAMNRGVLGIPIPAHTTRIEPQTLVIPLLGFDAACHRLGNGAGYYDFTLKAASPRPVAIGVGFELSRLESVYPQPHDAAMDFIVTEQGLQRRP